MKKVCSIPALLSTTTAPSDSSRSTSTVSPASLLRTLLVKAGNKRTHQQAFSSNDDEYDMVVVRAIRNNDVDALREMLDEGRTLQAANSNGETLLHLACRRSSLETVQFLVDEARVSVDVTDRMGRTVLHDVCWRPTANIELATYLLRRTRPTLWLAADARGHTCLDYCRKHEWSLWTQFLQSNASLIQRRAELYSRMQQ